MRQESASSMQELMVGDLNGLIDELGEWLVITRPPKIGAGGGPQKVFRLQASPQTLSPYQASQILLEGNLNAGEATPTAFHFKAFADVQSNDKIAYDGKVWKVLTAIHERLAGINLILYVTAVTFANQASVGS